MAASSARGLGTAARPAPSLGSRLASLSLPALLLLARLVEALPRRAVQRLGGGLGSLWYHVLRIRRSVVEGNLALAFPELPLRRRRLIARGAFRSVATTALELLWLGRPTPARLDGWLRVEGLEHYEAARRRGRGVLAVTAHLGSFDLLACSQALSGVPLTVVTKALSSSPINTLWMARRRATGLRLVGARGSMPEILAALRRGEVVGMVVDQRTERAEGGIEVDFFGRPALTTPAPAVLAARTGAAILPVRALRRPDGTHHVRIEPELAPDRSTARTMAAINLRVERWVRWNPEQWLWLHRRWRA